MPRHIAFAYTEFGALAPPTALRCDGNQAWVKNEAKAPG